MDKRPAAAVREAAPSKSGFAHVLGDEVTGEELGSLLRALREALGVAQGALAQDSGILYQNLSRLEHGRREVSISTMNRYLNALEMELVLVARPRRRRAEVKGK
jgi:predicted transcriptional regulator